MARDWSNQTDWCSVENAQVLARGLREYWFKRGLIIETHIEPISIEHQATAWSVHSNMVAGLPPKQAGSSAV